MAKSRRIRGFARSGNSKGLGAFERSDAIGSEVDQLIEKIRQWASQETASVEQWVTQLQGWRSELAGLLQDDRIRDAFGPAIEQVIQRIDDEIGRATTYIEQVKARAVNS